MQNGNTVNKDNSGLIVLSYVLKFMAQNGLDRE